MSGYYAEETICQTLGHVFCSTTQDTCVHRTHNSGGDPLRVLVKLK